MSALRPADAQYGPGSGARSPIQRRPSGCPAGSTGGLSAAARPRSRVELPEVFLRNCSSSDFAKPSVQSRACLGSDSNRRASFVRVSTEEAHGHFATVAPVRESVAIGGRARPVRNGPARARRIDQQVRPSARRVGTCGGRQLHRCKSLKSTFIANLRWFSTRHASLTHLANDRRQLAAGPSAAGRRAVGAALPR